MKIQTLPVLFLFLLLIGCAEKPKSVGNGLPNIDGIFTFVDTSFASMKDTTYLVTFAKGFSTSNLVGRISPTEELISLINFTPSSAIDSLKGATIDTAEIRLTVNYRFKSTSVPVKFEVVEVQKSWSQTTVTSDSLPGLTLGTKILGTFSDSMNFSAVSTVRLDTIEVRKWANSYIDSSAPDFYGFAIRSPAGITNGVIGFATFSDYYSLAPLIFIRYTKNGKRDSLAYYTGEDTYLTKYTGATSFSPLIVQGSFGIRSKLQFDLSSLVNKPIVNNAALELTLDTTASSFGGYSPDTVIALLGMSNTVTDQSDSSLFAYGLRKAVVAGESPIYSFTLTHLADLWVRSVKPNYGLTLRWAAEYGTVEKAVFFSSSSADAAKRPKLKITYAKK